MHSNDQSGRRAVAIVVGTTPDYIAQIHGRYPGRCLFLADPGFRDDPGLADVPHEALLFLPLDNPGRVAGELAAHLKRIGSAPGAVACFDCESLLTAGGLAEILGKPFPPVSAIARARNKHASRIAWAAAGVPCPKAALVSSLDETRLFARQQGLPLVLKPLSGSGGELIFRCDSERELADAVRMLGNELPLRRSHPLFRPPAGQDGAPTEDPCARWLVEEFVDGDEFSCDFVLQGGEVFIVRETGKIRVWDGNAFSVTAYTFPPRYPEAFSRSSLAGHLRRAAVALGFRSGHFMVDYILRGPRPLFLELTPRPGGDSIPPLVEIATGKDLLGIHLDFAEGRFRPPVPTRVAAETFASVHLYAEEEGTIRRLDVAALERHPSVLKVILKKSPGERILLPPHNYDDRLLGYCLVRHRPEDGPLVDLCARLRQLHEVSLSGPAGQGLFVPAAGGTV